jgi:hypothetical protein
LGITERVSFVASVGAFPCLHLMMETGFWNITCGETQRW